MLLLNYLSHIDHIHRNKHLPLTVETVKIANKSMYRDMSFEPFNKIEQIIQQEYHNVKV